MLEKLSNVYQLNNNIIIKGINDKYWALDTNTGAQFRLNELSFDILSLTNGNNSVDYIVEQQFAKYSVKKELLIRDILSFLETALNKGLISKKKE